MPLVQRTLCGFCDQPRPLCKSHIVPEACFKPAYDDNHKLLELTAAPAERKLQKGYRERLLCEECEAFFNESFEKYFCDEWLVSRMPRTCKNSHDEDTIEISGLDYARFKLFHLSVLWRSSIAQGERFVGVALGPHERRIRDMLRAREPGPPHRYPFIAQLLHMDGDVVTGSVMVSPKPAKQDQLSLYQFMFGGCMWNYLIGSHAPPQHLLDASLRIDGSLTLFVRHMPRIAKIRDFVRKHAETDASRGYLR